MSGLFLVLKAKQTSTKEIEMSVTTSESDKIVTISVDGRFDFSVHKDFRNAYKDHDSNMSYRVNLSKTEYLDSSALGMLLLLKKHAEGKVVIENPNDEINRVLTIANFHKVFSIE